LDVSSRDNSPAQLGTPLVTVHAESQIARYITFPSSLSSARE
jgi:hypothetical protein